jgi:alcohol dehydrogenase class IV
MRLEFATADRIIFGAGTAGEIAGVARAFGRRAFVVTGRNTSRVEPVLASLRSASVEGIVFSVTSEPTTDMVVEGTARARESGCDVVLAFGGGSAIDAAKAIAAMMTNDGELFDYLEVIGRGKSLSRPAAPCLAVPTTAGTGAEVTRNAVLASPPHRVKVSLRSPLMLPRAAIVDPKLTTELPADLTASTGLDALTQLIEPFTSCRANPLVDALCREALPCVARALRRACEHPHDGRAREDMCLASLFGGLALANAGLGAVHGFAGPIGGMFPAPHGTVCAALLPVVVDANVKALRQRDPGGDALRRYEEVGHLLTGRSQASVEDGIQWVQQLVTALGIPRLRVYGVQHQDIDDIVTKAANASSMKANPLPLTRDELKEILSQAI